MWRVRGKDSNSQALLPASATATWAVWMSKSNPALRFSLHFWLITSFSRLKSDAYDSPLIVILFPRNLSWLHLQDPLKQKASSCEQTLLAWTTSWVEKQSVSRLSALNLWFSFEMDKLGFIWNWIWRVLEMLTLFNVYIAVRILGTLISDSFLIPKKIA